MLNELPSLSRGSATVYNMAGAVRHRSLHARGVIISRKQTDSMWIWCLLCRHDVLRCGGTAIEFVSGVPML